MNGWAFREATRGARTAHLWEPVSPGWLRARCGLLPGQFWDLRHLRTAHGEFRKCRRCIEHEVRRG
jgi:hypothetical protein